MTLPDPWRVTPTEALKSTVGRMADRAIILSCSAESESRTCRCKSVLRCSAICTAASSVIGCCCADDAVDTASARTRTRNTRLLPSRSSAPAAGKASARRVGTSPAAATPKAIITAAQSEKKSNALASLSAAPESGCPSEASTAPRSRGASMAGPAGSEVCRSAVNPSSRLAMAPGSRTAPATGKTARPLTRPRRNQTSTTTESPPRSRKSGASSAPDATRITW